MRDPSTGPRPPISRGGAIASAAGLGIVAALGAGWMFRVGVAEHFINTALQTRGIESGYRIERLDLGGLRIGALRLGPAAAPDLTAKSVEITFRWGFLGPGLGGVRAEEPVLRARLDERGMSLGQLDRLNAGLSEEKGGGRIPDLELAIRKGRLLTLTPIGLIETKVETSGSLFRNFNAEALTEPGPLASSAGSAEGLRLAISATGQKGALRISADGGLDQGSLSALGASNLKLRLEGVLKQSGGASAGRAKVSADEAHWAGGALKQSALEASFEPGPNNAWRARAALDAVEAQAAGAKADKAWIAGSLAGEGARGAGEWTMRAQSLAAAGFSTASPTGFGSITLDLAGGRGPVVTGQGSVAIPEAHADREGREHLKNLTPNLPGTPLDAALAAFDKAIDRAMQSFSTALPFTIDWREGVGRFVVPGPVQVDAKSGAVLRLTPYQRGRPLLALLAPSGDASGAGLIALERGGFGRTSIRIASFEKSAIGFGVRGTASMENWEHTGGRLALFPTEFDVNAKNGAGKAELDGRLSLDAETGAVRVAKLGVPLQIRASWGDGMRVALREPGCAAITIERIGLPGMTLDGRPLALCPIEGALLKQAASGEMGGGFYVQAPNLSGRMEGRERVPIVLAAARIEGRFAGAGKQSGLQISARTPSFSAKFSDDRTLRVAASLLAMRTRQGPGPSMVGSFSDGTLEDPTLPAHVERASGALSMVSSKARTLFHIDKGEARLTARRMPGDADARPLFNPLLISGVSGALADDQIAAGGDVLLEAGGRRLAGFTARHDLSKGEGSASFKNPALVFNSKLDLYEISERVRGVVDRVRGPALLDLTAAWDNEKVATFGDVGLNGVNFDAAALGPVEGVSGTIHFRDLAQLATPPGQRVTIAKLNPGIEIFNGVVQFEVQGPDQVAIESARWPFAQGELSIEPQQVQVSSQDFSMTVTLKDVDVQGLIQQLDLKDLQATGTVEGSFPLVFSREGGKVVDGLLQAAPGGGTISYTGQAGAGLKGAPQIAFDALKSFQYDRLTLRLNGDLDGELVTEVQFTGENLAPVGGIAAPSLPIPGARNITATGLPFRFGVSITAPFRRLVENAQNVQDARSLVTGVMKQEDAEKQDEIDQPPPPK